jgi:hypothetical protein
LGYPILMVRSIRDIPKKRTRGRPPTGGRREGILVRLETTQFDALDAWISKQQEGDLTRPEAIRRLVDLGLKVKTPARPVSNPGRKLRAQELATKAIEKMVDPSAPPEERAERRRRLTKGPTEFREDRVDLPKVKGK